MYQINVKIDEVRAPAGKRGSRQVAAVDEGSLKPGLWQCIGV